MKRVSTRFASSLVVFFGVLLPAAERGAGAADLAVRQETDRVVITDGSQPVATYVFRDDRILRPYFAHVCAPGAIQVTRSHPPVEGVDPTDHDAMHPGIWLAFGDISGQDFWRNKARIEHEQFVEPPTVRAGQVTFTTANGLQAPGGERICEQISRVTLAAQPSGYLLTWEASFRSDERDFVFGDQEEMGLGVRVATAIIEKNGGTIRNSAGAVGASATWGKPAAWSDYSGVIGDRRAGILLMPDPANFRPSWFHNRDYGLMAANPFGRNAFTGGEKSAAIVKKGEPFRLRFGLLIHAAPLDQPVDLGAEYEHFRRALADSPVSFPAEGALPAMYPPDVAERSEPVEADYYLFSSPCRSLEQIDAIQQAMPPGAFTPPPADWAGLQRARRILLEGGELRLLAVGDSIVNDTMRSGWVAKLEEAYPKARIEATVFVRGGGGCQHYREQDRVAKYILPRKPDLVFIGGISQGDLESIRDVIRQIRAGLPGVEILLATGTFGTVDPRDAAALAQAPHSGTGAYGEALKALAAKEGCAYLDMTGPWAEYIRSANVHPHLFYRDPVHANEYGEQILAKIMMAFWTAP